MEARLDTHHVARVAAAQHGLIDHAGLEAAGATRAGIAHRVGQGSLHVVHRGVYAVGQTAPNRLSTWLAATMALGADAVLSHRAAGALWEILSGPQPVEVSVPRSTGLPHRDGIRVHRQARRPGETTRRHGVPCTTLVRTMLDLAALLDDARLARALEEAQVRHHLRPAQLASEVVVRPGQRGTGRLRRVLAGAVDPGEVESVLELRFLALCRAHGLPRPLTQVPIGRRRADLAFPGTTLVVETDGDAFHRTAAKRASDASRIAELESAGWRVLRLTYAEVVHQPRETAGRVAAALRAP